MAAAPLRDVVKRLREMELDVLENERRHRFWHNPVWQRSLTAYSFYI